jgi:hypothetical protein
MRFCVRLTADLRSAITRRPLAASDYGDSLSMRLSRNNCRLRAGGPSPYKDQVGGH